RPARARRIDLPARRDQDRQHAVLARRAWPPFGVVRRGHPHRARHRRDSYPMVDRELRVASDVLHRRLFGILVARPVASDLPAPPRAPALQRGCTASCYAQPEFARHLPGVLLLRLLLVLARDVAARLSRHGPAPHAAARRTLCLSALF